jgi:hypothetical protein
MCPICVADYLKECVRRYAELKTKTTDHFHDQHAHVLHSPRLEELTSPSIYQATSSPLLSPPPFALRTKNESSRSSPFKWEEEQKIDGHAVSLSSNVDSIDEALDALDMDEFEELDEFPEKIDFAFDKQTTKTNPFEASVNGTMVTYRDYLRVLTCLND